MHVGIRFHNEGRGHRKHRNRGGWLTDRAPAARASVKANGRSRSDKSPPPSNPDGSLRAQSNRLRPAEPGVCAWESNSRSAGSYTSEKLGNG